MAVLAVLSGRVARMADRVTDAHLPQLKEIDRLLREVGRLEFGDIAPSDVLTSRDELVKALNVAYEVMATGDNCGAEQLEYVEAVLANATLS